MTSPGENPSLPRLIVAIDSNILGIKGVKSRFDSLVIHCRDKVVVQRLLTEPLAREANPQFFNEDPQTNFRQEFEKNRQDYIFANPNSNAFRDLLKISSGAYYHRNNPPKRYEPQKRKIHHSHLKYQDFENSSRKNPNRARREMAEASVIQFLLGIADHWTSSNTTFLFVAHDRLAREAFRTLFIDGDIESILKDQSTNSIFITNPVLERLKEDRELFSETSNLRKSLNYALIDAYKFKTFCNNLKNMKSPDPLKILRKMDVPKNIALRNIDPAQWAEYIEQRRTALSIQRF